MKLVLNSLGYIDLSRGLQGIQTENTLETAIIVSLLTDRRAAPDDRLPDDSITGPIPPNRRGWCGDALAEVNGDRIGSRLWLLAREKQTEETRRRAIFYAQEALAWLIEDGHVLDVEIYAEWVALGRLDMLITVTLPTGTTFKTSVLIGVSNDI